MELYVFTYVNIQDISSLVDLNPFLEIKINWCYERKNIHRLPNYD